MALSKVTYVDGVTIIGAKNLNDIQDELIRQGEQQAEDEASLAGKAEASEVTAVLALKADKTETYTKAQVDSIVEDAIAEAVKESEYSNFEMKSVSGDFIHITDGAGLIPVKDLKIGIDAVQDLHGYDAPWVGGAGKNLFKATNYHGAYNAGEGTDLTTETANANYSDANDGVTLITTGSWQARLFATSPLAAGDYTFSLYASSSNIRASLYVTDGDLKVISFEHNYSSQGDYQPLVIAVEDGQRIAFCFSCNASGSILARFQVESGASATAYERPENICPISGWTGAKVTRTGKNLMDEANATIYKRYFQDFGGEYRWTSDAGSGSFALLCEPNTTYTVSCENSSITLFRVGYIDVDPSSLEISDSPTLHEVVRETASGSITITTGADAKALVVQINNAVVTGRTAKLQIELDSTATAYEPYNGTTYPVTWQTEAGTVYGGTLDVTTGELVVTWGFAGKKWSDGISEYAPAGNLYKRRTFILPFSAKSGAGNSFTNCVAQYNAGMPSTVPYFYIDGYLYLWLPVGTDENFDIELCAILNTPQTYQLTPTEVLTLLGENNIFADTGAVEELIYRISRQ